MKQLTVKTAVRHEVRVDLQGTPNVLASGRTFESVVDAYDREVGRRYRLGLPLESVTLVTVLSDGDEYVR